MQCVMLIFCAIFSFCASFDVQKLSNVCIAFLIPANWCSKYEQTRLKRFLHERPLGSENASSPPPPKVPLIRYYHEVESWKRSKVVKTTKVYGCVPGHNNARRGSCVIAPCIGGRAGRGRDGPVRPQ